MKWGIGDDPSMGDKVKITVLASGFDVTIFESSDKDENGEKPKETVVFRSGENSTPGAPHAPIRRAEAQPV